MNKHEIRYYKCVLRPKLWWMGNESNAKHYLVQKKDYSFRIVGLSGIRYDMKYKFTEDDIEMIRAKHPEFDMLFRMEETRAYMPRGKE
jgi:hypothetical protein